MVFALAFVATALASLFAIATAQRFGQSHGPHQLAWTVALVLFAGASAALAMGVSTGWDDPTYRAYFLCGAVLSVPWLALGTVYLLVGGGVGRAAQWGLVFFSGLAVGVMVSTPMTPVSGTAIPVGRDVFPDAGPRVLAALGSGIGATIVIVGALVSAARLLRHRDEPGAGRLAGANALIALGTVILSSGGLMQGFIGNDEAFTLSLATGIAVIYIGFLVADGTRRRLRARPG